jgi:transcriptional regulator with XRE-family HTH domain
VRLPGYYVFEVIKVVVKDAVAERFAELCKSKRIKPNELATLAGVTPSTVYSMLDNRRRDVSIVTIKKLCDGLGITLGDFFSAPAFDALEQEIK